MSLESMIKANTAALVALKEAVELAANITSGVAPIRDPADPVPNVPAPNVPAPTVAPATVQPIIAAPAPAVPPVAPVVTAPLPSEITKDQVLQELSAVNQKLGDNGVKLNALFEQMYPGHNLTTLDPAQYGTIVTAARGLVA